VWMVEACAQREERYVHRTWGGPPCHPLSTTNAATAVAVLVALELQRLRQKRHKELGCGQMQAAEGTGNAACPACEHLLLVRTHASVM